jgi:hypothetical protein
MDSSSLPSVGSSSVILGLIEGVADGTASFAKLYSGLYSDRLRRRKPLAVVGYFLTASGMASFAIATRSWHVLLDRIRPRPSAPVEAAILDSGLSRYTEPTGKILGARVPNFGFVAAGFNHRSAK